MMWQWEVFRWAVDTFGPIAKDRVERATRFVEEATELAQACGVSEARMRAVVERVYSRPPGQDPDRSSPGRNDARVSRSE